MVDKDKNAHVASCDLDQLDHVRLVSDSTVLSA